MSSRWVGLIRTSPSLYAGAHGTNPNLQIECVGLENCREFAQATHKADSVNRTMIAQDAASMNLNLWRWSAQFAWNAKIRSSVLLVAEGSAKAGFWAQKRTGRLRVVKPSGLSATTWSFVDSSKAHQSLQTQDHARILS